MVGLESVSRMNKGQSDKGRESNSSLGEAAILLSLRDPWWRRNSRWLVKIYGGWEHGYGCADRAAPLLAQAPGGW